MIENKHFSELLLNRPQGETLLFGKKHLEGKTILITGAAGSIGSKLCKALSCSDAKRLIFLDNAETPLVRLNDEITTDNCISIICSVNDEQSLQEIFEEFHPDYVVHIAASKHVPLLESNQKEAFKVNVIGTKILADLSLIFKVEKFIYISTDKAIHPSSLMGCTKRISELYLHSLKGNYTQFVITRFGNVLGSNGSVLERFINQIKEKKAITITDRKATRYFMSPTEACNVILYSLSKGKNRETFTFDMGKPVTIIDLLKTLSEFMHTSFMELSIDYIGLRHGEKLEEELFYSNESYEALENGIIKISIPDKQNKEICNELNTLIECVNSKPYNAKIKDNLVKFIDKYNG